MSLKELIQEKLELESSKIYFDESMKKHTSFKIGGLAECLIKIETLEDLKKVLKLAQENQIPITVMGNGSNVLVLDGGIKGITLQIDIKKLEINPKGDYIEVIVGAGNKNVDFASKMLEEEITGFEELSGIPGTIGGTIKMNAGAYGKEIKDIVKEVTFIDYEGNIHTLENSELEFGYRTSIFSNRKYVIVEATFNMQKGNKEEIKLKTETYANSRKEKQPLNFPSAGSTFKRGEDFVTAQLIDQCRLKGYKIGGAEVSVKHAGFVINTGDATAKDVIELTNYIKDKVYEKFQKKIELELEILGDN